MEILIIKGTPENPETQGSQFNKLPDEMIHNILDKLPLAEIVKTGLLSQRWRNLWKYITNIEIGPAWVESTGKEVVPSVNHLIRLHMGKKIKQFSVRFTYESDMSAQVDSWIQFATIKKVENLHLDLDVNYGEMRNFKRKFPSYVVNPCLFECDSLVILKLRCCIMALPISTSLRNLKEIYLHQMELENTTVYWLTSNTPVLEVLSLEDCNKHSDLHINVAPNPHFKTLMIHEGLIIDPDTQMHLRAPNAKEFMFNSGFVPRTSYNISVSLQCTKVALLLDSLFVWCEEMIMADEEEAEVEVQEQGGHNFPISNWKTQHMEQKLLNMLGFFCKAERLSISNWCVQVLSIRERRNMTRLTFNCKYLKLYTHFQKWELPGITYMLKACHELEEIIFVTPPFDEDLEPPDLYMIYGYFNEKAYLRHMESILDLPNLKTLVMKIKLKNDEVESSTSLVERIFIGTELGYNLTILLTRVAINLERVVLSRNKYRYEFHVRGVWEGCKCFGCRVNSLWNE